MLFSRKRCALPFTIKYNYDRIFIAGSSGSGKTYVVQHILKCMREKGYKYRVLTNNLYDYDEKDTYEIGYDIDQTIENFCRYGVVNSPILLIFEDVPSLFFSPHPKKVFQALMVKGRHIGIGFIFVSHTTTRIPTIIIANSNKFIFFKITDLRQLSLFNIPDLSDKLLKLKQYEFYYYDRDQGIGYISKI